MIDEKNKRYLLLPPNKKSTADQFIKYMKIFMETLNNSNENDIRDKQFKANESLSDACRGEEKKFYKLQDFTQIAKKYLIHYKSIFTCSYGGVTGYSTIDRFTRCKNVDST